ncbi:hypothetical protein DERP_003334, partial [Dermatophagoides pteronyssinus]
MFRYGCCTGKKSGLYAKLMLSYIIRYLRFDSINNSKLQYKMKKHFDPKWFEQRENCSKQRKTTE